MCIRSFVVFLAVAALAFVLSGCDELEAKTSYQGQLTDSSGAPVADGNYQMTFRLYDAVDDAVGSAVWTETQAVSVQDGLFNITLGSNQPITAALFAQKLWLGVEVESDGEMTPRQQLTGAPYAMSLVAGAGVQGTINRDELLPGSLNVHNSGTGFGIAVNALGEAGVAIDGSFANTATGQNGLLVDNFMHGAVITSTDGTGVQVQGNGGQDNDHYGLKAESEIGDGVFGWGHNTDDIDTGVTGRGDHGFGVYGFTINGTYGLYTGDALYVGGGCTGCTARYVGTNASNAILRPGDVVSAVGVDSLAGMPTPVMKVAATTAGATPLGVVAGRVEMYIVEEGVDDAQPGAHFGGVGGPAAQGDYLIIVVQGPVQVRATDTGIKAGDRVYQSIDGVGTQSIGPPIGMALDSVDDEGLVWVLVGFD